MNPILRNILAVLGGVIVGSVVNMALVNLGPSVVPLPEGADISTMEGLKESMKLFTPANFIFPFLGHAVGTLAGAYTAARISANNKLIFAMVIGVFFLAGGAYTIQTIGGPTWFNALDLIVAYIPMAWFGYKWASPLT